MGGKALVAAGQPTLVNHGAGQPTLVNYVRGQPTLGNYGAGQPTGQLCRRATLPVIGKPEPRMLRRPVTSPTGPPH